MERKAVFGVTLTLLLISVLTSVLTVFNSAQAVEITGPIRIRADGSVDPPTAPILRNGDWYTLTDNITITSGSGIVIKKSNITLDGAGYELQGSGGTSGISFEYYNPLVMTMNVTIKNLKISGFTRGMDMSWAIGISIIGNSIIGNNETSWGIGSGLGGLVNTNIIGNSLTNHCWGILLEGVNNSIIGNVIRNNKNGISFGDPVTGNPSVNNVLRDNSLINNSLPLGITEWGPWLSVFNDVDASNTVDGKTVYWWVNKRDAAVPTDAGDVVIGNCTNITVQNLNLTSKGAGIQLVDTTKSLISKNNIANTGHGISLSRSSNNTISGNSITNNEEGITLSDSSSNLIYHNNFINNTSVNTRNQVVLSGTSVNTWDDGYPSGGNLWSGYNGVDSNGDGIGDTPYAIDANNQDRYPLAVPVVWDYSKPIPIAWEGAILRVALSSSSTISTFKFNQPQRQISFTVTGPSGTTGYCNVTIPKQLLWAESSQWTVLVNGVKVTPTVTEDANYTYLYFTYSHSTKTVEIRGSGAIAAPQFLSATTLLLLMILAVFAALASVLVERRFSRKLKT